MGRKISESGPQFVRFFEPLIQALQQVGGSANSADAIDKTVEVARVSDAERANLLASGESSRVDNQIAWARLYLAKAGYIDSTRRGVWALTPKGMALHKLSHDDALAIFRDIQLAMRNKRPDEKSKKTNETVENESPASPDDVLPLEPTDYRQQVLQIMQKLPPEGFERLCQRILRESGLDKVEVTGRVGDGGIDGEGNLQVGRFSLVSFKVLFQCKRYQGSVGSEKVREFRGAMAGRTDKGIFITTGSFTAKAKEEAVKPGVSQIELVDGEKLVDLLESIPLGLKPVETFDVDTDFFKPFQAESIGQPPSETEKPHETPVVSQTPGKLPELQKPKLGPASARVVEILRVAGRPLHADNEIYRTLIAEGYEITVGTVHCALSRSENAKSLGKFMYEYCAAT
jgi:restriction system protein